MPIFNRFRNFDVYIKPIEDYQVKTSFGGLSKEFIEYSYY